MSLLSRPGAVVADPPDTGVAAHYGDPYAEQRALAAGEALVDLSHRPVVRIAGPDRLTWLHSLLSQHLTALQAGVPTQALVLSPQGHVEHHLQLVDDGTQVLAHVEPGTADTLIDFLRKMQFMLRVEVSDVSDEWAVVADPVARLVPRSFLIAYEGPVAGVMAYEALRVERREPRLGLDTDHRTIPHEVGWLSTAVHLDKGCYRGQETVARVHNLGRPPRRLVLLHLDGSDSELPAAGDAVQLEGRDVGRVGTAVRHHELGPLALALVKRQVPDAASLLAGTGAASIDPEPAFELPVSPARQAASAREGLLRRPR
ncbi:MAG: folate-binding protein YgfZ [Frankiales bacterium]|nr:folate-binding protein YgfZ [Frankiales bacterium]